MKIYFVDKLNNGIHRNWYLTKCDKITVLRGYNDSQKGTQKRKLYMVILLSNNKNIFKISM